MATGGLANKLLLAGAAAVTLVGALLAAGAWRERVEGRVGTLEEAQGQNVDALAAIRAEAQRAKSRAEELTRTLEALKHTPSGGFEPRAVLESIEKRVADLERSLKASATRVDVTRVESRTARLEGDSREMVELVHTLRNTLADFEDRFARVEDALKKGDVAELRAAHAKLAERLGELSSLVQRLAPQPVTAGGRPKTKTPRLSHAEYVAGAATVELFKAKSFVTIPELPVGRQLWKRDLNVTQADRVAYEVKGSMRYHCLLPELAPQIGSRQDYVARLTWFVLATKAGKYGFTMSHTVDGIRLSVAGKQLISLDRRETAGQGTVDLDPGYHRAELLLLHDVQTRPPLFQLKILRPGGGDSEILTKDQLFLPKK